MAGGFGFSKYPQRPAPGAEDVGRSLMQQQAMPGAVETPMAPTMPMADPLTADRQMRLDGAQRMGAPGQVPDMADDDGTHSANALSVAVGEALTRQGGGYTTNPNPFKDRAGHVRQLMQLGLSEVEAQLLVQTGGV